MAIGDRAIAEVLARDAEAGPPERSASVWTGTTSLATGGPAAAAHLRARVAAADAGCGSAACEPLWTASSGSSAVSGGQLYVGTADGQIIAYGLP